MECILCGDEITEEIEYVTRKSRRKYFHCSYCDLIFLDRSQIISEEEEKARYLMHNNTDDQPGYIEMFSQFLGELEKVVDLDDKNILDYGSGPNPVLKNIIQKRYEKSHVTIYDPYFYPVLLSDTYDIVISTEVFEHFTEIKSSVAKVVSLLKNRGILAVMTNFHNGIAADFIKWWYISDKTHISFYSRKTMQVLADIYNLDIIHMNGSNTVIFKKKV